MPTLSIKKDNGTDTRWTLHLEIDGNYMPAPFKNVGHVIGYNNFECDNEDKEIAIFKLLAKADQIELAVEKNSSGITWGWILTDGVGHDYIKSWIDFPSEEAAFEGGREAMAFLKTLK